VKPGRDKERIPAERAETPGALQKPRQPGRIRAFILAGLVHAAFFALIVFGVNWQSSPTAPLVAELWDKLPPAAKPEPPKPEPPKPEPEPPKPEPPKPEPEKKPEPPKPEPPAKPLEKKTPDVKPEPPKPDPAIAEKAKREKEKRERLERERVERERVEREREEKRKAEDAKKKREQEEAVKKKREQEEAAKKKQEDDKRRREEDARKREAEKARAEAAARKQSEVEKYIEQIRNRIRSKANVPDTVAGNPEVQVRLRILPGGEVLEATITRSSGNRAYDAAIERAIRSASPLPVPSPDSELFPQFRDLILNIRHER